MDNAVHLRKLHELMAIPKISGLDMIVFDLDYTLLDWSSKFDFGHQLYPFVPHILNALRKIGYKLAIVSFNSDARYFLEYHDIACYFDYVEYEKHTLGATKKEMLLDLEYISGIKHEHMLFFDDSQTNIDDAKAVGIQGCCCKKGIDEDVIKSGIQCFCCQENEVTKTTTNNTQQTKT